MSQFWTYSEEVIIHDGTPPLLLTLSINCPVVFAMPPQRHIFPIASTPRRYFSSGYFHFKQLDPETAADRWTCCRIDRHPLYRHGWDRPVSFHMLAYISPYQGFLTRRGDGPFLGEEGNSCMASCWLNPCIGPQMRNRWRKIQRNILTLRAHVGVPLQIQHIFRPSPVEYLWSIQVGAGYCEGREVSSTTASFHPHALMYS